MLWEVGNPFIYFTNFYLIDFKISIAVGVSVKDLDDLKFIYENHEDFVSLPTYFIQPGLLLSMASGLIKSAFKDKEFDLTNVRKIIFQFNQSCFGNLFSNSIKGALEICFQIKCVFFVSLRSDSSRRAVPGDVRAPAHGWRVRVHRKGH